VFVKSSEVPPLTYVIPLPRALFETQPTSFGLADESSRWIVLFKEVLCVIESPY
jgi:hypothetical protein